LFFATAGASSTDIRRQLEVALKKAESRVSAVTFVSNSYYQILDRAVNHWVTHPSFLNAAGRPKPLPASGEISVAAALDAAGYKGSFAAAIETLQHLGSVSQSPDKKYRLKSRFCNWNIDGDVCYEPNATFLMNAVLAGTTSVRSQKRGKKLFWFSSYSDRIPKALTDEYLRFVRARIEAVLRELDDWFGKHEVNKSRRRKIDKSASTVGIGVFPFVQSGQVGKSVMPALQRIAKIKKYKSPPV
jgi:hypothetical protein